MNCCTGALEPTEPTEPTPPTEPTEANPGSAALLEIETATFEDDNSTQSPSSSLGKRAAEYLRETLFDSPSPSPGPAPAPAPQPDPTPPPQEYPDSPEPVRRKSARVQGLDPPVFVNGKLAAYIRNGAPPLLRPLSFLAGPFTTAFNKPYPDGKPTSCPDIISGFITLLDKHDVSLGAGGSKLGGSRHRFWHAYVHGSGHEEALGHDMPSDPFAFHSSLHFRARLEVARAIKASMAPWARAACMP